MLAITSVTPLSFASSSHFAAQSARGATPVMTVMDRGPSSFDVRAMPGISAPLGFFDPLEFSNGASEGKIKFYREVELKHGRVAMLASLGFLVAEQFHPLWGGKIDVPSVVAWQATPLQSAMPAVAFVIAIHEVLSIFTFNSYAHCLGGTQRLP